MGVVVDPREETEDEEEANDEEELSESLERCLEDLPALEDLDDEAGKKAKLGPGWSSLQKVKKYNG